MVWVAENPNLREASCCIVDVMKGACGLRVSGFATTLMTDRLAAFTAALAAMASFSLPSENLSSFLPSSETNRAGKSAPLVFLILASNDQYSWFLKFSISVSRSHIRRRATDWTRPAERAPGSLRHKTGESVKPTR